MLEPVTSEAKHTPNSRPSAPAFDVAGMLPGVMLFVGGTVESGMAPLAWVILFLLCLLAYSWGGALVYAFEIHNVLGRILIHIYACAAVSSIPFSLLAIFWWSLQFQSFGWEGRTPAAFVLCLLAIALVTSMLLVERARRMHTFEKGAP